jgi:adenosylcobyric acid synthase
MRWSSRHPRPFTRPTAADPAIAVIRLPHISNFTDFDPLAKLPAAGWSICSSPRTCAVSAPSSCPVRRAPAATWQWLAATGWRTDLLRYAAAGGHLLGICGGYQMLGTRVRDPTASKAARRHRRPGPAAGGNRAQGAQDHHPAPIFPGTGLPAGATRSTWARPIRRRGLSLVTVQRRNGQACADTDGCTSRGRPGDRHLHARPVRHPGHHPALARRHRPRRGPVDRLHGPAARDQAYEQLAEHAPAISTSRRSRPCCRSACGRGCDDPGTWGQRLRLAEQVGCRPEEIIDMSSNINPLGALPGLIDHLAASRPHPGAARGRRPGGDPGHRRPARG